MNSKSFYKGYPHYYLNSMGIGIQVRMFLIEKLFLTLYFEFVFFGSWQHGDLGY